MFERSRSRRAYRVNAEEAFPGEDEHGRLGGGFDEHGGFDEPGGQFDALYGELDGSYDELDGPHELDGSHGDLDGSYDERDESYDEPHVMPRDGRRSILLRRRAGVAVVALVAMAFSALVVHALRAGLSGNKPASPASGFSRAVPRTAPIEASPAPEAPALTRHVRRPAVAGTARGIRPGAHQVSSRQSPPRARVTSTAAVAVHASPAAAVEIPPDGPSRTPEFGFER